MRFDSAIHTRDATSPIGCLRTEGVPIQSTEKLDEQHVRPLVAGIPVSASNLCRLFGAGSVAPLGAALTGDFARSHWVP